MSRITNNAGLDITVAIWLATDEYIVDPRPNAISVTRLIKPIRQIILGSRIPEEQRVEDIADRISSALGHTLHRGIEYSWKMHYATSMAKLGYPKRVIEAVRINPEKEEPDTISVYTESRSERPIGQWIVSGQIDLIVEGRLRDAKSTKVWGYMRQKSVEQWKLQGSIYRWLNPGKITHDELVVQYLLLDWNRAAAKRDPNYPPHALPTRAIGLLGLRETEEYIKDKIAQIVHYKDAPEATLPECSEEDLWRSEPVWKYYANPEKTGRSTKNFEGPNAAAEAKAYMSVEKGGKGLLKEVPGTVKACNFCAGFLLCSQKDRYIADGTLAVASDSDD